MTEHRIRGSEQATAPRFTASTAVTITGHRRLLPSSAREGGGEFVAHDDELVRVELENGFVLWTRADDLLRERGRKTTTRDGGDAWEIDLQAPSRDGRSDARGQRGLLGLSIKVLEFFGINITEKAARKLGSTLEEKLLHGNAPGLYRCPLDAPFALSAVAAGQDIPLPPENKPLLIFLHGTASSCAGSFGKLWSGKAAATAARAALVEKYGDRVYAWEHRSLTQSPIQNALELARRLPPEAEIHLVSHSRGGLVGELLCLAQRDAGQDPLRADLIANLFAADRSMATQLGLSPLDEDAARERDKAYDDDRGRLEELLKELDQRKPQIRRFVRAACPARGTTLASGRLDRWLSVVNFLTGDGLIADGADFLLDVVKERTDPRTLPGLEAMMPGSALTRLLAHPGLVTTADLTVISGDIEGDGLWSQIKLLITDWFYGADHDLVVNTGSMYGGLRRPEKGARFLRDQGPEVCHFNYFDNDKSVRWLAAGLLRVDGGDGGFLPIAEAPHEEPRWREAVRRSRTATTPRPLAVMIPGTMGSALKVKGDDVWLDYWCLLRGGLKKLDIAATGVEPTDLLDDFYGPLLEFLARSHQVEIFPYDWRLSVRDAAKALARKLADWLPVAERSKQPVHLVAHSMGGLVVRAMIADGGEGAALWRRIQALPNSRFLMLGTPNFGSHEGMRWLTGLNPTQAKLSLLDFTQGTDEIVDLVRRFPGLVELLPFASRHAEFGQADTWKKLRKALGARWQTVEDPVLRQARETWTLLRNAPIDPDFMIYVAGCQDATVADYRLEAYDLPWLAGRKRLEFDATRRGDGTVTWESGILPDVPVWYARDTAHDELCARRDALPGYLDLLMTGKTTRLAATPPDGARAQARKAELFPMPLLPPTDGIPDAREIVVLGIGPSRPPREEDTRRSVVPMIQVSVIHGDLAYSRHPVMVGHYAGDLVVSAEAAVDRRLDGALSQRQRLGLYPGPSRTHAVFINEKPGGKPAGAIVIGLGQVGGLSAAMLQTSIRDALLDYALQVTQWPADRFPGSTGVRSAAVSCLLVGTGPGGVAVVDSVEAVLRGAVAANERLATAEMDNRVLIDRLEFLELYEDTVIVAAEALETLLCDGQLANTVAWTNRVVEEGQGRRRRVSFADTPGWWHRMEIIEEKGGGLRFIAATDRARAEVTQATGQLRLAEGFIRQASRSPGSNPEVAKTLFEMLLPNRLKELAPSQGDLVLLVDEASARYPWELLEDRWSQNHRPPAVTAGMVRQFKTAVFRPHPAHAAVATAYVVGNPNLDGWNLFPDLPGAREEARKVAAVLGAHGYKVHDCIDENADEIMDGLHKDAWRILHLAGHGEHRMAVEEDATDDSGCAEEKPSTLRPKTRVSGMVIGKNTFLTPGDVQQMRWVPELVFINCCHLGKTQAPGHGEYSPLAANLAVEFIEMGVKAVVAAGWAVDDAAAGSFAESFYKHMLNGNSFGEAVRAAREEIWVRYPQVNTWGAYQCYGDPGFQLVGGASGASISRAYHAPGELIADLDNHREGIRVQTAQADNEELVAAMRERIGTLLARVPEAQRENWLARADVAAAMGFVWGETGDYAEAVAWLERALAAKDGDCPMRAVEQCANFRVRRAGQEWGRLRDTAGDGTTGEHLVADIRRSLDELEMLCQHTAPTRERLNLLGGSYKRLAWISTDKTQRLDALKKMSESYRRAFAADSKPDPYPFANWAVADILVSRLVPPRDAARLATLDEECRHMASIARERNAAKPEFWAATGEADCELALLLHKGALEQADIERVAAIYRAAMARGASPREAASVCEHLDFLIDLASAPNTSLRQMLQTIRASL